MTSLNGACSEVNIDTKQIMPTDYLCYNNPYPCLHHYSSYGI